MHKTSCLVLQLMKSNRKTFKINNLYFDNINETKERQNQYPTTSYSRSQLIQEIEAEDADNLNLDDFSVDGRLDKKRVNSEVEVSVMVMLGGFLGRIPWCRTLVKFFTSFKSRNWKVRRLVAIVCFYHIHEAVQI